jgi:plasmid maintenance system antidote protein VapI
MGELTDELLNRLRKWCAKERGRKAEISRLLDISAQGVSNLLADRQQLTGEQALKLQAFLKKPHAVKRKPKSSE